MFEKLKKKKRLREEQKELVEFFLKEYSIEDCLAKSFFTDNPYEIELSGRPNKEVKEAVHNLDYGEILEKETSSLKVYQVFKANPKKFNYEKVNGYFIAYEYIVKEINKIIDMKRKCGIKQMHNYIKSIPYFDLNCYLTIKKKLKLDFPNFEFDIYYCTFDNDSILVSGCIC